MEHILNAGVLITYLLWALMFIFGSIVIGGGAFFIIGNLCELWERIQETRGER